ncbi:hypothetical protein Tco_0172750 [Tanacetum coccineum]
MKCPSTLFELRFHEVVLFYNGLVVLTNSILEFKRSIPSKTAADAKMSKVLQERGFGSLPSSTETNPRDHVKSISTIVEADSYPIRRMGSSQYAVSTGQNRTLIMAFTKAMKISKSNSVKLEDSWKQCSTASSSNLQNVAFVSENTSSTNEVSTAYGVSNTSGHNSKHEQTSSYSLLASQSSCPQLIMRTLDRLKKMTLRNGLKMASGNDLHAEEKQYYKKTW